MLRGGAGIVGCVAELIDKQGLAKTQKFSKSGAVRLVFFRYCFVI